MVMFQEWTNPLLNRTFHSIFYSVLYIITSPLVQLLLYQVLKFKHPWYNLGLMHPLFVIYFIPMIVSLVFICIQVQHNYHNFQRSPFFFNFGQIFAIGALAAV